MAAGTSETMSDINVTPMVDVMLVLLIIFMVVTPTIMAGFSAVLPTGDNLKARPEEEGRVVFGVDVRGNYYLDKKPVAREQVPAMLAQAFRERPQDKVLFLKADANLPYEEIITVMKLGRDAGARVLAAVSEARGPVTDEPPGGGG
jgi:biopolymer transport protein ExbD